MPYRAVINNQAIHANMSIKIAAAVGAIIVVAATGHTLM